MGKETDYTRNEKIQTLTSLLDVPYNHLPCMIFIEDLNSKRYLCIPFVAKKEYFKDFFRDILTCIQKAGKAPRGERLNTMNQGMASILGEMDRIRGNKRVC